MKFLSGHLAGSCHVIFGPQNVCVCCSETKAAGGARGGECPAKPIRTVFSDCSRIRQRAIAARLYGVADMLSRRFEEHSRQRLDQTNQDSQRGIKQSHIANTPLIGAMSIYVARNLHQADIN